MLIGDYGEQWKTVKLITRNFWWLGVTKEIKQYMEEYDTCQQNKNCTEQLVMGIKENLITRQE